MRIQDNPAMTKQYSEAEHATWQQLYYRQLQLIEPIACQAYWMGFDRLGLDPARIPDRATISARLDAMTGWTLVDACKSYLSADEWFGHLVQRQFPVTSFIRDSQSLDYTPLPDLFHEYFGHLPFLTDPGYAGLIQRYGQVYQMARSEAQRLGIARLWWFSMEFGFLLEEGQRRIVGASLFSSYGEHRHAIAPQRPLYPFDIRRAAATASSTHSYHGHYFIVESFDQLCAIIEDYAVQEGLVPGP